MIMKLGVKFKVLYFLICYFLLSINPTIAKDKNHLSFSDDCGKLDEKVSFGKDEISGCRSKMIEGKGEVYANYTTKKQRNGNLRYVVDKFLYKTTEEMGKHLYCDTDVDGLSNVFNRVQCHVVTNDYCEMLYTLKNAMTKCLEDTLTKFDELDEIRNSHKEWFKLKRDGAQSAIDLIAQNLGGKVNLDFSKGPFGIRNQHGYTSVRDDFETPKSHKNRKKQQELNDTLIQRFDPELEMCNKVYKSYDDWKPTAVVNKVKLEKEYKKAKEQ